MQRQKGIGASNGLLLREVLFRKVEQHGFYRGVGNLLFLATGVQERLNLADARPVRAAPERLHDSRFQGANAEDSAWSLTAGGHVLAILTVPKTGVKTQSNNQTIVWSNFPISNHFLVQKP